MVEDGGRMMNRLKVVTPQAVKVYSPSSTTDFLLQASGSQPWFAGKSTI